MQLAWLTDIHLNFVNARDRQTLLESLDGVCDAVVITGDIGESPSVARFLREIELALQMPIYFVLGNHDFYRGSIAETRDIITRLAASSNYLVYLTAEEVVQLTQRTALVGHDGWADARLGDFDNSDVTLNDYVLIEELRFWNDAGEMDKRELGHALNQLGDEAANQLRAKLLAAVSRFGNVIAATHVPPFREATWHEGQSSDDNWLPHFSSKATGEAMLKVMQSKPDCHLQVLCGHTHGGGETQPLGNVNELAEWRSEKPRREFDTKPFRAYD